MSPYSQLLRSLTASPAPVYALQISRDLCVEQQEVKLNYQTKRMESRMERWVCEWVLLVWFDFSIHPRILLGLGWDCKHTGRLELSLPSCYSLVNNWWEGWNTRAIFSLHKTKRECHDLLLYASYGYIVSVTAKQCSLVSCYWAFLSSKEEVRGEKSDMPYRPFP